METVKEVSTNRYIIALVHAKSGMYYVKWQKIDDDEPITSPGLAELGNALYMFDHKLQELQGN
jgi:hypothetical protein